MKELVRLRTRPSGDGRRFTYMLDYVDENGKRRRTSLGHADGATQGHRHSPFFILLSGEEALDIVRRDVSVYQCF